MAMPMNLCIFENTGDLNAAAARTIVQRRRPGAARCAATGEAGLRAAGGIMKQQECGQS